MISMMTEIYNINIIRLGNGLEILDQSMPAKDSPNEKNIVRADILKRLDALQLNTQLCGVTLTFKNKYILSMEPKALHRLVQQKLSRSTIWRNNKYILIPEFTNAGRLHYHGVIYDSYQAEVLRCVTWWRRTFGFVKTEMKISVYNNWKNYIIKDYSKTGLWTLTSMGE